MFHRASRVASWGMASGDSIRDRLRSVLRTPWPGKAVSVVHSLLDGVGASRRSPRGPYLQGITVTSAVIACVSEGPGAGEVEYGKTPELERKGDDTRAGRRHVVALAGLDSGSIYHYRVASVGGPRRDT
jgi:hypothetical protein